MQGSARLRIYFDTSVFSSLFDERVPDRRALTEEFWGRLSSFEVATSALTREELEATPDPSRRAALLHALEGFTILTVTPDMHELARRYVTMSGFQPSMYNDALHVAAAVITRQDVLVSWNFKHLVNRRRRAEVMRINVTSGLSTLDIVAPPEV